MRHQVAFTETKTLICLVSIWKPVQIYRQRRNSDSRTTLLTELSLLERTETSLLNCQNHNRESRRPKLHKSGTASTTRHHTPWLTITKEVLNYFSRLGETSPCPSGIQDGRSVCCGKLQDFLLSPRCFPPFCSMQFTKWNWYWNFNFRLQGSRQQRN